MYPNPLHYTNQEFVSGHWLGTAVPFTSNFSVLGSELKHYFITLLSSPLTLIYYSLLFLRNLEK